jgi:tetratricopeptide (TPR) repeat protein
LLQEEDQVARQFLADFPEKIEALCLLGDVCRACGHSREAAKCWETCLKLDPRCAAAHHGLGILALECKEYEEAARRWRVAIQSDPRMPGVHLGLGRTLIQLGRPAEAIPELQQEVAIDPKAYTAWLALGQAYLDVNAFQQARQSYEKAAQLQPEDWHAYYGLVAACEGLGQSDKAQEYRQIFQKFKAVGLETYYREVNARRDLASITQRVALDHSRAARGYFAAGNLRQAEEHWRRAAELAPKDTACRRALAALYQRTNRDEEALHVYQQLRDLDPQNPVYHFNVGAFAAGLRRFDDAEAAFRKAIRLAPRRAEAYRALASLYLDTLQKLPEARTLAETAAKLEPSAANFNLVALACHLGGDREAALLSLERAIKLDPGNERYRQVYAHLKQAK